MDLTLRRLAPLAAVLLLATPAGADAARDRWVQWHRTRALRLEAEGRQPDAVEEWVALSRLLPADTDAAVRAAVSMVEVVLDPSGTTNPGDDPYRTAEELVRIAVQRGAVFDPAVAYAIGRLRLAERDYATSLRMLDFARVRGYEPIRTKFWHYRAAAFRSREMIAEGSAALVVPLLERCIRDVPGHPDEPAVRIFLGNAYCATGKLAEAETALAEIVAATPWAARAHLSLGDVYAARGKYAEADAAYRVARARSLERDDGFFTGRGVMQETVLAQAKLELLRKDLPACERIVRSYLELAKDAPEGLHLLAVVLIERGGEKDLREAAKLLRQARRLVELRRGAPVEILDRLGFVLDRLGETKERDEILAELARFRPTRDPAAPPPAPVAPPGPGAPPPR